MARGLTFCIKEEEKLYYLCSENKGADQLHGYREADLGLCFRICKNLIFSRHGSYYSNVKIKAIKLGFVPVQLSPKGKVVEVKTMQLSLA